MSNLNMTPKLCTLGSLMFLRCFQNKPKTTYWLQHAEFQLPEPSIGFHVTIWSITVHSNWDGQLLLGSRGTHSSIHYSHLINSPTDQWDGFWNGPRNTVIHWYWPLVCRFPSSDTSRLPFPTCFFQALSETAPWLRPVVSGRGLMVCAPYSM